ncbi:ABC1 kinase family protein [Algisphaera agarilytica]|uniref:Ubiquinone biosynthesis protein n=1 Tax=Algisphaera agarilytica TaxID=1385975 RepID=A0A7X0H5C2_9BACT|nr:AarF/UbiB family protein [Algisphaera agarilytica]MBB6429581.1 ubiquinone biosynthesis protein [Algisphaera agarilytica]
MSIPNLPGSASIHAAKRGGELAAQLFKFGFGEIVSQTGLAKLLPAGLSPDPAHHNRPAPERLRLLIEELGPTFIKAGQVLSTRPDLIPAEFANEFKKLQANVPPAPWEGDNPDKHVHAALRQELGDRFDTAFQKIDPEPLAAASMAQVHRATLADGTHIVLKVLRPGIDEVIAADLQLMGWLAGLADGYLQNLGFDAPDVVEEFTKQLERETDLRIEADSTQRMSDDFADEPGVNFPKVYREVSTRGVLALEHVQGTLLSSLDTESISKEQRLALVGRAADAVFRQCLSVGFFHADPHPGNIFVDVDTASITFIDCGMVGSIDPRSAEQLAQITHGTIEGELDRVVRTAIRIADADPTVADDRRFRADVWRFIDNFKGGSLESLRMGQLLDEFFEVMRKHQLRCPADIVYLIKSLTTIEGVAQELAPEFDLVGHVRPYVTKLVKQRFGFRALKRRVRNNAVAYADLLDHLPYRLDDLMRMVRQNRTTIRLEHQNLDKLTNEVERASKHIAWAVILGAVILGASILVLADQRGGRTYLSVVALVAFVGASSIGLFRLLRPRI